MNTMSKTIAELERQATSDIVCSTCALMVINATQNSDQLARCLESVFTQTVTPDQLVMVANGPIDNDQETIIDLYRHDARISVIDMVRLSDRLGQAEALHAGLEACTGEWIMCVDCDHINRVDRLAIQLDYVTKHPDVDIFPSWCEEFTNANLIRIKASPVEHNAVVNALRWRNIIVQPSCLIRTTVLRRLGYRSKYVTFADYDLMIRMAMAGVRFRVVPATLVSVQKRSQLRNLLRTLQFRCYCLRLGFLTLRQFLIITPADLVFRS